MFDVVVLEEYEVLPSILGNGGKLDGGKSIILFASATSKFLAGGITWNDGQNKLEGREVFCAVAVNIQPGT